MKKEKSRKCKCPFCESELEFSCLEPPFCKPCRIKFTFCKKCGEMFNEKLKKCPKCGIDNK